MTQRPVITNVLSVAINVGTTLAIYQYGPAWLPGTRAWTRGRDPQRDTEGGVAAPQTATPRPTAAGEEQTMPATERATQTSFEQKMNLSFRAAHPRTEASMLMTTIRAQQHWEGDDDGDRRNGSPERGDLGRRQERRDGKMGWEGIMGWA